MPLKTAIGAMRAIKTVRVKPFVGKNKFGVNISAPIPAALVGTARRKVKHYRKHRVIYDTGLTFSAGFAGERMGNRRRRK